MLTPINIKSYNSNSEGNSKSFLQPCIANAPVYYGLSAALADDAGGAEGSSMWPVVFPYDVQDVRVVYGNFYCSAGVTGDNAGPNNLPVKASLLIGSNYYPFLFGSSATATIEPGGVVESNPLGIQIPAGTVGYILTYWHVADGEKTPTCHYFGQPVNNHNTSWVYDADYTASGTFDTNRAQTRVYGPLTVRGVPYQNAKKPAIAIIGDSINANTLCATSVAINDTIAQVNIAFPGEKAAGYQAINGAIRRNTLLDGCTAAVVRYGTNDIVDSTTIGQLETYLTNIYTALINRGIRVYAETIPPRVSGSDTYCLTGAVQTAVDTNGAIAKRTALNAWIKTCSLLSGYFDTAAQVQNPTDATLWKDAEVYQAEATSTSGTNTTHIYLSTATWPLKTDTTLPGGLVGYVVKITAAASATVGTLRLINSNDAHSIGFSSITGLAAGDKFEIYRIWTYDGIHPSYAGNVAMATAIDKTVLAAL